MCLFFQLILLLLLVLLVSFSLSLLVFPLSDTVIIGVSFFPEEAQEMS